MEPDLTMLEGYHKNTAIIMHRERNTVYSWAIAANPDVDNEDTLREHLRKHYPNATLIAWAVK